MCQLELRPVLLGSPSTVVTLQFIRLPVTGRIDKNTGVLASLGVAKTVADENRKIITTLTSDYEME